MNTGLKKSLAVLGLATAVLFVPVHSHAAAPVKLANDPRYIQALRALDEGIPQVSIQKLNDCLASKLSTDERALATLQLSRAFLLAGQPEDALKALQRLPAAQNDEVIFLKAQSLSALGRWNEACPFYHQLAARKDAPLSSKIGEAECLHALGKTGEAIQVLESVVKNGKTPVTVRLRLADYYMEENQVEKCEALFNNVETPTPTEFKWKKYIEGRLLLAKKQYEQAQAIFREVLDTRDGLTEGLMVGATLGMADTRLALSGPEAADNVIEDFLWQHPETVEMEILFQRLDQIYAAEKTPSDSELQKWTEKNPPDKRAVLATYYLAKACARTQKPDKALAALEVFIAANPTHPLIAEACLLQGELLRSRGKMAQAVRSFETAIQRAPDKDFLANAEMSSANAYFEQGDFVMAQKLYRSAADHSERLWQKAVFNSALSWLNQANYDKFWSDYKELNARFPKSEILAELVLEEGLLQARSSDARAEKTLKGFIEGFPNHPRVAEARLALAEMAYLSPFQNLATANNYLKASNDSPQTPETSERAEYLGIFLADSTGNRDEEKVIKACRQFITDHSSSPLLADVYMKLGQVYFRRGEWLNAQTQFETLAHDLPASPLAEAALFLAGQAALKTMNTDRALERFSDVVKLNKSLKLFARQQQAILKAPGNEKDAILLYDDILGAKPDGELKFAALGGKADIYFLLGIKDPKYFDQAIATYNELATLPDVTSYWRNQALYGKGRCFEKQDKTNEALAAFYDVIQPQAGQGNGPEYLWFYKAGFEAAHILEDRKQWKAAIAIYQKMAAFEGPRSDEAKARLTQLRLDYFIWED